MLLQEIQSLKAEKEEIQQHYREKIKAKDNQIQSLLAKSQKSNNKSLLDQIDQLKYQNSRFQQKLKESKEEIVSLKNDIFGLKKQNNELRETIEDLKDPNTDDWDVEEGVNTLTLLDEIQEIEVDISI